MGWEGPECCYCTRRITGLQFGDRLGQVQECGRAVWLAGFASRCGQEPWKDFQAQE